MKRRLIARRLAPPLRFRPRGPPRPRGPRARSRAGRTRRTRCSRRTARSTRSSSTSYGRSSRGAGASDARLPVLALRTTPSGGHAAVEIVGGTVDDLDKLGESIEFDETTQTVFVVYSRLQGFFVDMHVAMRRERRMVRRSLPAEPGSLRLDEPAAPRDAADLHRRRRLRAAVTKTRSILSIVWWEESGASQARYAPSSSRTAPQPRRRHGVEPQRAERRRRPDRQLGPSPSSYMHPGLQRDPARTAACSRPSRTSRRASSRSSASRSPTTFTKLVPPDGLTRAADGVRARPHADRAGFGEIRSRR